MLRDGKAWAAENAGRPTVETPAHLSPAPADGAVAEAPSAWPGAAVRAADLEGAPLVTLLRSVYAAGFEAGRRASAAPG